MELNPLMNEWKPNGTLVGQHTNSLVNPKICPDGSGGAIMAWETGEMCSDIYAQGINSDGNLKWEDDIPIRIINIPYIKGAYEPRICTDKNGGAIIAWEEFIPGGAYKIGIQHINSDGIEKWPSGMSITNYGLGVPELCSDDSGGAIIVFVGLGQGVDIYAQRIDQNGIRNWTSNGKLICGEINNQNEYSICSDGAGGAIIAWQDERDSPTNINIYAQRIDKNGNIKWTPNGVPVCTEKENQNSLVLCSDEMGGAIIAWQDARYGSNTDIFAKKLDKDGNQKWIANGTAITLAENKQYNPQICSDGANGAIITWTDRRDSDDHVYAQCIDYNGFINWESDGIIVCNAPEDQEDQKICINGLGGAFITWEDERSGTAGDIYAQNINSFGKEEWQTNGVPICTTKQNQEDPIIHYNGTGAIIAWEDYRYGDSCIFAQYINKEGNIGGDSDKTPPSIVTDLRALDITKIGFVYPTGHLEPYIYSGWLDGGPGMPPYQDGFYHLGQDMEAEVGDPIFAISDGEIVYVSVNDWGDGNYGLLLKHKSSTGEEFIAIYGHVRPILQKLYFSQSGQVNPSIPVKAGDIIATVGPYDTIPHLHFGIHPGADIPSSPFGRMPISSWKNTNGFVNATDWIITQIPNSKIDTSSKVILLWTAPGDDENIGTALKYDLRYFTSFITENNWNLAYQGINEPNPQPAGSYELFIVNDLSANTKYYFALKTVDDVQNESDLSNNAQKTTSRSEDIPIDGNGGNGGNGGGGNSKNGKEAISGYDNYLIIAVIIFTSLAFFKRIFKRIKL